MILKNHLPASSPPDVRRAIEAACEANAALRETGRWVHSRFERAGGGELR